MHVNPVEWGTRYLEESHLVTGRTLNVLGKFSILILLPSSSAKMSIVAEPMWLTQILAT